MPLSRQQLSALGVGSMGAVGLVAGLLKSRQKPARPRQYLRAEPSVPLASVSAAVGSAPPVTQNLTYERILEARSEPENWLTYYGAYDGQRYSPLDQIDAENVARLRPAWVFQFGAIGCRPASRPTRSRPPRSWSTASCSSRAGTGGCGRSTPGPAASCGAPGTRCRSTRRCAAA